MKIAPVASPHQVGASIKMTTSNNTEARQRAVSMLSGDSSSPSPVQNQNQVAPEEMAAITNTSKGQPEPTVDAAAAPEVTPEQQEPPTPALAEQEAKIKRTFDNLARQEKLLRQKAQKQDQDLKTREAALQAREAAIAGKDQDYSQNYISKDMLRRDPITVLAEAGFAPDEIVNRIANPQPLDPRVETLLQRQEAKIKELEAKTKSWEDKASQQQSDAYQSALGQIEQDVRSMVKTDPAFATIRIEKAEKAVVDLIERTFKEEKRLMTNEEAASEVEAHLEERAAVKISQLSQVDRIKKRLEQSATASKAAVKTSASTPPQQTQPMKTLTNAASTSRQLSARERAILAFKNELKS